MQAVIMAGGKGTRLASVTKDIPKPMVPIDQKPLLEYQIENLRKCGFTDIILVVGFLGDVIKDYFKDGKSFGVNITYYVEEEPLGTAGALYYLKDRLDDNFILLFGDLFVNIDFNRLFSFHIERNADISLFSHPNSHPYDSDIIVLGENGRVTDWLFKNGERTSDYLNLVNAGVYAVSSSFVKRLTTGTKQDLEKNLIVPSIQTGHVFAYKSTEYVKDIGTPERLLKVTDDYHNGVCEQRNLIHRQKCIFLDRDGTLNEYVGLVKKPDELTLVPTAPEAVRLINESEYLAVVITNQPVIARGDCSFEELDAIHNRMYTLLGKEGSFLDGLYFCPHHPDSGYEGEVKELKIDCDCRKPKIGMLKKASEEMCIDLSSSWFVGDTDRDILTGINAGMRTVKVSSLAKDVLSPETKPDYYADNVLEAVKIILNS